jgi:hypothetical protein
MSLIAMFSSLSVVREIGTKLPSKQANSSMRSLFPTFLGIGSMRCGSTWLYQALKCHPDIRLSDAKELDFFFMPKMLKRDLNWYVSRFQPRDGEQWKRVRGEISPLYARLKRWQVNRIAELLPDLRIILTLRHPIDRVWSQAVYEFGFRRARDVRGINAMAFLRQVERPRNTLSSDYCRTIDIWSNAFGRDALHIDFFDRIQTHPNDYINSILRHIGLSTPWKVPDEVLNKKIWATNNLVQHERQIPELVEWYIADRLLKPTERLNHMLDGKVSNWVDELRSLRAKTRLNRWLLGELNRLMLSLPETLAYKTYHLVLDAKLWLRWQQLRSSSRHLFA